MKKRCLIALLLIGLSSLNYGMSIDDEKHLLQAISEDNVTTVELYMNRDDTYKNYTFKLGGSPLLIAVWYNRIQVARLLLENGADSNIHRYYSQTPLHYAARYGFEEMGALLIKCGALLEPKDCSGKTPLYYAVFEEKKGAVQFLLQKGADWAVKDNEGKTPYDIASPELKKIIERHVAIKESRAFLYGAKDPNSPIGNLPSDLQKVIIFHVIQKGCTPKDISEKITT